MCGTSIDKESSEDTPSTVPIRDRSDEPHAGNSRAYAIRRLGRASEENPEKYKPTYDRLISGEISANFRLAPGHHPDSVAVGVGSWPGTGHRSEFVIRSHASSPASSGENPMSSREVASLRWRVFSLSPQAETSVLQVGEAVGSGVIGLSPV
jgi:hypothetical protein